MVYILASSARADSAMVRDIAIRQPNRRIMEISVTDGSHLYELQISFREEIGLKEP